MRARLIVVTAFAAALIVAWAGRLPVDGSWAAVYPEPQDGTGFLARMRPGGRWAGMAVGRLPDASHSVADLCGRDEAAHALIARSDYDDSAGGLRVFETTVQSADGDTVSVLPECALICALPTGRGAHELLVWRPDVRYEPGGDDGPHDAATVFMKNFRRDFRYRSRPAFFRALTNAPLGAAVEAECRLSVVTLDGTAVRSFGFDARYTPGAGRLYDTAGGRVALVETDTAYANSDLFYVLFEQPTLSDGEAVSVTASDDIEGSFRGLVAVDPDEGVTLWYRRLGVMCLKRRVVDLDLDGVDEILLESYGIENQVSGGGTTDAGTAYLLCLDQGGNILWRHRVLGTYCGVQCAAVDVSGDERLEVVVTWSSGRHGDVGGVVVLGAGGEILESRSDLGGLYGLVVADLDGDDEPEIATGAPHGEVLILDGALRVESRRAMAVALLQPAPGSTLAAASAAYVDAGVPWKRRAIPLAAAELSGGGPPELVVLESLWSRWDLPQVGVIRAGRGDVVVLDHECNELLRATIEADAEAGARFPSDMPASMKISTFAVDLDGNGTHELALWTRPGYTFSYWGTHEG